MWYLFFQIWLWLVAAFILGWFAHWFFCCRDKTTHESDTAKGDDVVLNTTSSLDSDSDGDEIEVSEEWKPMALTSAPTTPDDLKRIKGIGGVIEQTLNGLGVYQFAQIAEWTEDNVAWVEKSLKFKGRIGREQWISQAKTLAEGGTTDFASRVDTGDVDY
ncbi:MAG: hypothetical protein AAF197_03505 [Pseudomonadota bacterium]